MTNVPTSNSAHHRILEALSELLFFMIPLAVTDELPLLAHPHGTAPGIRHVSQAIRNLSSKTAGVPFRARRHASSTF